jgi:hypothetical protein
MRILELLSPLIGFTICAVIIGTWILGMLGPFAP